MSLEKRRNDQVAEGANMELNMLVWLSTGPPLAVMDLSTQQSLNVLRVGVGGNMLCCCDPVTIQKRDENRKENR